MIQKSEIRLSLLARRGSLSIPERVENSLTIQEKLLKLLDDCGIYCRSVGLYSPVRNEVETSFLFESFRGREVEVCYPRVNSEQRGIDFFKVTDLDSLSTGSFGILEPEAVGRGVQKLDVLILPGIAFDRGGYRLGYGQGFYDRFLESFPVRVRIGMAFDFQVVSRLPKHDRDAVCDFIVTEKQVIKKENALC